MHVALAHLELFTLCFNIVISSSDGAFSMSITGVKCWRCVCVVQNIPLAYDVIKSKCFVNKIIGY